MARGSRDTRNAGERPRGGRVSSYGEPAVGGGSFSARIAVVFAVFLLIAVLFAVRLVDLQVVSANETAAQARDERTVTIPVTPERGTIYDRNGRVLAASIEATTVTCDPTMVENVDEAAIAIAQVLGGKPDDYKEALSAQDTHFAYLQRQADASVADKLEAAAIPGVFCTPDTKRVYPNGSVAGQILGFVNIDGEAVCGLELYYDEILAGVPGEIVMERGENGIAINGTVQTKEAVPGTDITISLDIDMQNKLEQSVQKMAKSMKAKSGQSLVLDGATGEILAIASTPLLDPSNREDIAERATECQCITRAFEPGSVFKTVTMLAALEEGAVTPNDSFYCPAQLPADEYFVSDAHERDNETMTATQILVRSSNVGISLIAKRLGFEKLDEKIKAYGLDMTTTGVDYPGESGGYLLDFNEWSRIQGYNISFGQGISETPIQMARFYGAITNDGVAYTPHFLLSKADEGEVKWKGKKIIRDAKALEQLREMLKLVVAEGTGVGAQINGYSVAGKTGTAEYVDEKHPENGYLLDHYNNSFMGFLPETDSKLVCFVGATEVPSETATTDVFQDIMSFAIERYNINPIQE